MLIRYYLQCKHCQKITALRIAVGYREKEPFYFGCENCSQTIRGNLVLDQKNIKIKGLEELEGAIQTDTEDTDYVITYDSSFSHQGEETMKGSPPPSLLTPFLQAFDRLPDIRDTIRRIAFIDRIASDMSSDLERIIRNYKSENWSQFERGVRAYIPEDQPTTLPVDRNHTLYQVIDFSLSPIAISQANSELIQFFASYTINLARTRKASFKVFLEEINTLGYLKKTQYEALDLVPRFFQLLDEFKQVLPEWDPENFDHDFPPNLKVTAKFKYHDVKSLYVDAYELICRALTVITGLINLTQRGNHNTYIKHPSLGKNFYPSSITDFHDKPHAPKLEMLREELHFYSWLAKSLDPKIRNAIGHNSLSYNSSTGDIRYPINRSSTQFTTISYGEFLTKVLRIFLRTHQVNHLINILFVYINT